MFRLLGHARLIPLGARFIWHVLVVQRETGAYLVTALKSQQSASLMPASSAALRTVQRLNRIVRYCGRRKLGTCLHHSLAAWRILDRQGIKARIAIAPQSPAGQPFLAHAWLEVCGGYVIGQPVTDVAEFKRNEELDVRGVHGQ
jgi:hypothetical protein